MSGKFSGSSVAIVTPMLEDGAIDFPALFSLLEWHISEGTDGIIVAGTTGESPTLAVREHQELIARVVAVVDGRAPVVAGVGANSTREAIVLTRQAQADGADGGLSVTPYYNKPTQEGLYRHFSAIAAATDLPLILYDIPGRCVVPIENNTLIRLAEIPSIVGVKDAVGDAARPPVLRKMLAEKQREGFLLLSGDDKTALDYLLAGGDGVISVTANIAPRAMRDMVAAARAGDTPRARKMDAALHAFHLAQGVETNPIPVKAALLMMDKIKGGIRLPLTPLSAQYESAVRESLEAMRALSATTTAPKATTT